MSSNRNYTGCTEISGEPDDNTKNIVFRIEQSRWKAGHPEYVRIRAQLSEIKDIQIGVKYYQLKQMKKWQQIIKRTLIRSQQDLF